MRRSRSSTGKERERMQKERLESLSWAEKKSESDNSNKRNKREPKNRHERRKREHDKRQQLKKER